MKNKLLPVACLMLIVISATAQIKPFNLYNQVRYSKSPSSLAPFLLPIKIASETQLLNASDSTPNQAAIQNFALTCPAGVPVCLDLETWPYYPSSKLTSTINKFLTTISYFKSVNTTSSIGFYGVPPKQAYEWSSIDPVNNPGGYYNWRLISDSLARMAKKVDNFQPSFYAYDADTTSWRKMVDTTIAATKRYSATKPIYAFIWPQYHQGTKPLQLQFIDTAIWRFQLETLYKRTDGVILWTSNKDVNGNTIYWDINFPWWQTTKSFMVGKQLVAPFVLDSFNVFRTGNAENIRFSTAVDTTTRRFVVQRGIDGINFTSVSDSIVPISTYFTENNYQYNDISSGPKLYYRLQIISKNGTITYSSTATAFAAGILAVLRIGGVNGTNGNAGSSTAASAGSAMHIDKYSISAGVFTYQSSIDLPAKSTTGADTIFTSASTGEGYITQSADNQWLSVLGYTAKTIGNIYNYTTNPSARTLGLIKYDGTVNLSTKLSNFPVTGTSATANAAITTNGTDLWCVSGGGLSPIPSSSTTGMGVLYSTANSLDATSGKSAVVTSTTGVITGSKSLSIFGGDLYYVAGSGNRIGTVSAPGGLPTTAGTSIMTGLQVATGSTALSTLGASQMVMFDLDSSILGYDVMYFTNSTTGLAGIYKYCKNAAGKWVSYGTFGSSTAAEGPYFGITGEVINGLPFLYVTRGVTSSTTVNTNQLIQLTETVGYNANMNAALSAQTDATVSGMNGTIRGVAFFPEASYYYKGIGILNDVTSWGTNIDGTGTAPVNFTEDDQTFFITNGTNATFSENMVVSGIKSKIILGDGTNTTSLTIPPTYSLTSEINVYNNATLNILNAQTPYLHFVAANSTVNFASPAGQTINPMAYGNFSNNNNGSATLNGTITVANNMVQNGFINGNATLIVPNGLNNTGTIAPGNDQGLFTVTGNFTNNTSGILAIDLAGNTTPSVDYDQLLVSGTASIGGTLNISLTNNFAPQTGQTFTIVSANALTGTFATVNWPDGIIGTVTYTATSVVLNIVGNVLPLQLVSFSGSVLQNGKNQLQWNTANEVNVQVFAVERSSNGNDFTTLTSQTAVGQGNNSYSIIDEMPLAKLNYYRLKMMDKDGHFTYSSVIKLENNSNNLFSMYPNPAKNNLIVTHPTVSDNSFIQIVQPDGKVVFKQNISVGSVQTSLDISTLHQGLYVVYIYSGKDIKSFKLIKE